MEVLTVLLIVFIVSLIISKLIKGSWQSRFSGNLAMCLMLCFTAIGHVIYTEGMTMMIPSFVPFRKELVYLTGIMEVIMGVLLLFPGFRRITGIVIIIFFILILPCNIYEAVNYIDLATASYNGAGPDYLWFRIPLQVFLIGWVYYFSIRMSAPKTF
jgi:uncharacterized membrane protein